MELGSITLQAPMRKGLMCNYWCLQTRLNPHTTKHALNVRACVFRNTSTVILFSILTTQSQFCRQLCTSTYIYLAIVYIAKYCMQSCKLTSLMHTISHRSAISAVFSSASPKARGAGIGWGRIHWLLGHWLATWLGRTTSINSTEKSIPGALGEARRFGVAADEDDCISQNALLFFFLFSFSTRQMFNAEEKRRTALSLMESSDYYCACSTHSLTTC